MSKKKLDKLNFDKQPYPNPKQNSNRRIGQSRILPKEDTPLK